MAISKQFQFQLKLATMLVVFIYVTLFIDSSRAAQVTPSSYITKPGMSVFLPRKMQQQEYVTEGIKETHQPQHDHDLGIVTPPMVDDWQLRMVPSGPNPLHHHRSVPMRPRTP